jgi:hypothetical protein
MGRSPVERPKGSRYAGALDHKDVLGSTRPVNFLFCLKMVPGGMCIHRQPPTISLALELERRPSDSLAGTHA